MTNTVDAHPEPPRWAFWRYGYVAYKMIREHQRDCIKAHEETTTSINRIEKQVNCVGGKVDQVLTTVQAFVQMQPELKTSITQARDRKVVWRFLILCGEILSGAIAAIVGMITIALWVVPFLRSHIGGL